MVSDRGSESAATGASDWVWISGHGFTDAGQLDPEPFEACDDVEEAHDANVELAEGHEGRAFVTGMERLEALETEVTGGAEAAIEAGVAVSANVCFLFSA